MDKVVFSQFHVINLFQEESINIVCPVHLLSFPLVYSEVLVLHLLFSGDSLEEGGRQVSDPEPTYVHLGRPDFREDLVTGAGSSHVHVRCAQPCRRGPTAVSRHLVSRTALGARPGLGSGSRAHF